MKINWNRCIKLYGSFFIGMVLLNLVVGAFVGTVFWYNHDTAENDKSAFGGMKRFMIRTAYDQIGEEELKQMIRREEYDETTIKCKDDFDCLEVSEHAKCEQISRNESFCVCEDGYTTADGSDICDYKQVKQLTVFLVSFLVGWTGADWHVAAKGDAGYHVIGVVKLFVSIITCCTCNMIWVVIDWTRALANTDGYRWTDGNGVALGDTFT